jgi:hypothetical protein
MLVFEQVVYSPIYVHIVTDTYAEMLLTLLSQKNQMLQAPSTLLLKTSESTAAGDTHIFLSSKLQFQKDARGQDVCLVDTGSEVVGVMMGWESEISECGSLNAVHLLILLVTSEADRSRALR